MKSLNEIQNYLEERVAENKQNIREFEDKILEAEKSRKQADEDLLNAENEVNADKYNQAKNAISFANHAKELYQKQKEKLENNALSKQEKKQMAKEIVSYLDQMNKMQFNEVASLVKNLETISNESIELLNQGNELLNSIGVPEYKKDMVYGFYNQVRTTPMYRIIMKDKGER